ncbi:uncharacterized protein LOC135372308 [Ornithodoros turicata]|uniref:uncharacterized protein LOC135372308 n=1 Tax=Ornithodoros turicata TaxID=34597 RepID=UPI0031389DCF
MSNRGTKKNVVPSQICDMDFKMVKEIRNEKPTSKKVCLRRKPLVRGRQVRRRQVEVEDRLRQVKDKTAAIAARNKVIGILQNANLPPKNITKAEQNALKDLRNDDTIVILPADKGKATVILNRDDYDNKMESILQDRSHFSELSGDPTAASERKIVAALRKLRTKKLITDSLYWKLFTSDGATPKIYGLPKVHKNNCPLRPIVSFIGAPSYNVSKFLAELLAPLMYKNDRSVKNSAEFCELIRDIRIDDGDVMMSFDVISLFTNVPIDVALSVVRTKLRADVDLEDRTDLSVEDILELLKLCLRQTFFQFKNRFFKQTDGCPMGSPISTTIAKLVMEFVEDKALEDAGQFITFYRRYVDDKFVIIKKNFTNTFFDKLNSIHPNIQFTCEEEKEKKIAFLDVLVQRDPCGNLKTSVYRKPCDTDAKVLKMLPLRYIDEEDTDTALEADDSPELLPLPLTNVYNESNERCYTCDHCCELYQISVYSQKMGISAKLRDELLELLQAMVMFKSGPPGFLLLQPQPTPIWLQLGKGENTKLNDDASDAESNTTGRKILEVAPDYVVHIVTAGT